MKDRGYDQLARGYGLLEFIAFGRALERARFRHFERLRNCKRILLLGDGDGRGLALVCQLAPDACIDSVDTSEGMLKRAARRLDPAAMKRVTFIHADALTADVTPRTYDAVTTLFFLDCFSPEEVTAIIARIRPALTPEAVWLYADFALPPRGWPHWRARFWLALMFLFFRWQTGLKTRARPPSEELFCEAGFVRISETSWQGGFLRSAVYRRL